MTNENPNPRIDNLDGETVTLEQQQEVLAALDALDNPVSPEAEHAQQEQAAQSAVFQEDMAQMEAQLAISGIELAIQTFVHPRIHFSDEQKQSWCRDFAPVLIKYGALIPAWLEQYKEEIFALKALGALGYSAAQQFKTIRLEEHEAQRQAFEAKRQQAQQQDQQYGQAA